MEGGPIPPVAPFDCSDPGKWEQWKQAFDYYLSASNIKDEARKVALFLHMGGPELQELYHAVSDPTVKAEKLQQVIEVLDSQLLPKKNTIYERHVFRREAQRLGEGVDTFVARLRKVSRTCEYGSLQEDMIRDQLVDKCCSHKLRCALLREPNLTLTTAVSIARTTEEVDKQAEVMESGGLQESSFAQTQAVRHASASPAGSADPVSGELQGDGLAQAAQAVRHAGRQRYPASRKRADTADRAGEWEPCFRCGRRNHDPDNCFIQGRKCFNCGKIGHLQRMCPLPRQKPNRSHANAVTEEDDHSCFRIDFEIS